MSINFERLRSRAGAIAIAKCVLTAVTVGALVFAVPTLIFKLVGNELSMLVIGLIALAAALVAGLASIPIFYKSRRRFAKELDEEYGLGEKAQTMLAFENEKGDMLAIQRENADKIIGTLTPKRSVPRELVYNAAAILLAAATLTVSLVIPATSAEPEPEKPYVEPFEISAWQIGALQDLIDEVNASDVYENVKTEVAAELTRLLGVLKETDTVDEMTDEVIAAIVTTDLIVEAANTYKILCVALNAANDASVKTIARAVLNVNGIAFGEKMDEIRADLEGDSVYTDEETGEEVTVTLAEKIASLSDGISSTLTALEIAEPDALYTALLALSTDMAATLEEQNAETQQSLIDKAFSAAKASVGQELSLQYRNRAMRNTVKTRLISIFDIDESALPELLGDIEPTLSDSGDSEEGEDNKTNGGGYDDGEEVYGSNDLIYDPFAEDGAGYVVYGDAYDSYYAKIEALLLDGNLSPETQKILIAYFTKLSNGASDTGNT